MVHVVPPCVVCLRVRNNRSYPREVHCLRHHKWPWKITRHQVANILHVLARAVAFSLLPFVLPCGDATVLCFTASLGLFIMMNLQIRLWAHCTKSRLPPIIGALQNAGVLVSWMKHAAHHRPPYNNNYCMVNGVWNGIVDKNKVFESLEMVLSLLLGVRPRSWSDPRIGVDGSGCRGWRGVFKYDESMKKMSSYPFLYCCRIKKDLL